MNTLVTEQAALIRDVRVTGDTLELDLTDGRSVAAPLARYPRLLHGTPAEREGWEVIGQGQGVHWPARDEEISLEGILAGRPSAASRRSLQKWLQKSSK